MDLNQYRNQLSEIEKEENIRTRNIKLSRLMSKMEFDFQIPALNDEKFNEANREVISLYREISNARIFNEKEEDEKGKMAMKDKLKLKCPNCNEILKLEFSYDGCDWNSVKGEGSGYYYSVDLVCPNCGRIYPIVRTKGEYDAVEYIEKLRPYNS